MIPVPAVEQVFPVSVCYAPSMKKHANRPTWKPKVTAAAKPKRIRKPVSLVGAKKPKVSLFLLRATRAAAQKKAAKVGLSLTLYIERLVIRDLKSKAA